MAGKITLDMRIKDLDVSERLKNAMNSGYPKFFFPDDALVRDYIHVSDNDLLRIQNFGRKSLVEWKRVTAPLRDGYSIDKEEESAEYEALKKIRATLNHISGAHKNLARLYEELANTVLPVTKL